MERKDARTAKATARERAGVYRRTPVAKMPQSMPFASGSSEKSIASAVARRTVSAMTRRPTRLSAAAMKSDQRMPM
jgi:hypothetical protein